MVFTLQGNAGASARGHRGFTVMESVGLNPRGPKLSKGSKIVDHKREKQRCQCLMHNGDAEMWMDPESFVLPDAMLKHMAAGG